MKLRRIQRFTNRFQIIGRQRRIIRRLPIEAFWGVGPITAKKMHTLGIYNGETLRKCSLEMLQRQFGKNGLIYFNFARGMDDRPVEAVRIRKSIGCEHTLEKDISLHSSAIIELYHVVTELLERLKRTNFSGNTLTLKIKCTGLYPYLHRRQ